MKGASALALSIGLVASGAACRALGEALDHWPRYPVPGSKVSLALPAKPTFTEETLSETPCGDLASWRFSVSALLGTYSGRFIPMTPRCARDPSHAVGMQIILVPSPGDDWRELARESVRAEDGQTGQQRTFQSTRAPARFRIARTFILPEGVLALLAEGAENPAAKEDAHRFFRSVKAR